MASQVGQHAHPRILLVIGKDKAMTQRIDCEAAWRSNAEPVIPLVNGNQAPSSGWPRARELTGWQADAITRLWKNQCLGKSCSTRGALPGRDSPWVHSAAITLCWSETALRHAHQSQSNVPMNLCVAKVGTLEVALSPAMN